MEDSNRSANPSIHDVSDPARRMVLRGGLGAALLGPLGAVRRLRKLCAAGKRCGAGGGPRIGFKSVPASAADRVVVPEGYSATRSLPWGEPVGIAGAMPAFQPRRQQQRRRAGGADGHAPRRHPLLPARRQPARPAGDEPRVHRRRAAAPGRHGDLERREGAQGAGGARRLGDRGRAARTERWQVVRPSPYARRFTASTPIALGGPAAGHRADAHRRRSRRAGACSARSTTAPAA